MQLVEFPFVLADAVQGAARPKQAKLIALSLSQMPRDVGRGVQPVRQRIKQQGRRNADVIALREAEHRDADVHIGVLNGIIREAEFLSAKHQGHGLVERQGVGREVVAVRASGHNLVALLVQTLVCRRGIEILILVMLEVEPLRAAHHHLRIHVVMVHVLHDVDILNATQLATAQHRAGIVRLENVFQNDGDMACPKVENLLKTLPALVGDEL